MAISVLTRFRDFCFPQVLRRHRTYPRLVFDTWNEPQNMHFFPLKKLAAQLKTFFRPCAIWIFYYHMVTKRPNYLVLFMSLKFFFFFPLKHGSSRLFFRALWRF